MRATRVLAGAALLLAGACGGSPSPKQTQVRTVASTTTTTVVTVPATTTTAEAPQRPARASRGATAARVAPPAPAPPAAELGECGMWGYKSRARSDECWGPAVGSYGDWPVGRMLAILYCESKGNPWVVNSSNHVGLFQIKNSNTKGDGPANIAHAHGMWLASGTAPWRQCGG